MAVYSELVQAVESPFDELIEDHFPFSESFSGPEVQANVQGRMLLILLVVATVGTLLSILGSRPSSVEGASPPLAVQQQDANQEPQVGEPEVVAAPFIPGSGSSIAAFFTPEVKHWESKIVEWAAEHEVDPNAVATIMQIESCGDPQAVSVAGAQGLFQVMPFHFSNGEDMQDPDTNARRGMNFLNEQLRYTGGDIFLSFAGYNGGYAASGGNYANWANETQRYYEWAKGIYEDASAGAAESPTLDAWLAAGGAAGCQRAASRLGLNS